MGEFEVVPMVRLRGGSLVRPDRTVTSRSEAVPEVRRLLSEHDRVLLRDLDGIERNRPRLDLLRKFEGDSLWVNAGIRTADAVIDVLVAGAEKAVLGTKTLRGLGDLQEARNFSDDIAVEVDVGFESAPGFEGWSQRHYLEWSAEAGLDTCLVVGEETLPEVEVPSGPLGVYVGVARKVDFAAMESRHYRGAIVDAPEAATWTT